MSFPVVDQNTPVETIIALAQMGGRFRFRCLACGKIHYLEGEAWEHCSQNYYYANHTTIRGVVAEVSVTRPIQPSSGTIIALPWLSIEFPQIYAHKLALHDEEQAALYLAEYTRICNAFSSIHCPRLTLSNNTFVPLHIMIGWEKLRQFAYDYGILPENSPFQHYRRAVLKCMAECAAFIREHKELFTPFMPIPIKIVCDASLQQISAFRDDGKVVDFIRIRDECKKELGNGYHLESALHKIVCPTVDFIHIYKCPSFAIIKGFECIAVNDSAYSIEYFCSSPPLLTLHFKTSKTSLLYADPVNLVNREDPITDHVLETIEEIQTVFKSTLEDRIIVKAGMGQVPVPAFTL